MIMGIAELRGAERTATTARRPLRLPDSLRTELCAAAESMSGETPREPTLDLTAGEGGLPTGAAERSLVVAAAEDLGNAVGAGACDEGADDDDRLVSPRAAWGSSNTGCLHCGFGQRIRRPRNRSSTRNRKLHESQENNGFIALDPTVEVSSGGVLERGGSNTSDGGTKILAAVYNNPQFADFVRENTTKTHGFSDCRFFFPGLDFQLNEARMRSTSLLSAAPVPLRLYMLAARNWFRTVGLIL